MLESSGDRVTWTYDATDRLTREQRSGASAYDTTYTYDPLGNRLVKEASGVPTTYAYDSGNQLTNSQDPSGLTTYTYDLTGNLQVVEQPSGQRTTNTWDDQNRQTRVLLPAGGVVTSAYRFDGLRHEKAESEGVIKYIWDFNNYLAETDDRNEIQAVCTNEPEQYGNLISQYRKGPAIWVPSYYKYDAIGSTRVLPDGGGNATDTYLYDAWGNELSASGSTVNPFRWVGQVGYYWDEDIGTFYIRARVYEPVAGRWMSQDPAYYPFPSQLEQYVTESTSWNALEYVECNPLMSTDPSGLVKIKPASGVQLKGSCGSEFTMTWDFMLETTFGKKKNAAPCKGWIVQHVTVTCGLGTCYKMPYDIYVIMPGYPTIHRPCCGCDREKEETFEYWEAWPVEQGQPMSSLRKDLRARYTDSARWTATDNRCGEYKQAGEVRFFCETGKNPTGDLNNKTGWQKFIWRPDANHPCRTTSHALPSTSAPPSFWGGASIDGPAQREFEVDWFCCKCEEPKDYAKASAKPPPK